MHSRRHTLFIAGAAIAGLAATAACATAQTTTTSSSTNSCPSQQTVMTSTWYGSTSGYLCAQEYHDGNVSVGAGASDTFSTSTNVAYFPQYYCWDSSDDKDFTYSHAEIFGSGSVTATNWGTGSHVWGAGYLYTLGSGSVTGWTNGCYDNSDVWQQAPDLLRITSVTASGLPDNGASKAGTLYSVSASVAPASYAAGAQIALQDNGVSVAGGVLDSNGNATISWRPAEMGSHTIRVAWPGQDGVLGNISDPYTVTVSGGVAVTVDAPVKDNGNGTATASVAVDTTPDPFPTGAEVILIDTTTKAAVGKAALTAPSSGTSTTVPVTFKYTGGQSFRLTAQVQSSTGSVLGQSYITPFQAPLLLMATWPTSQIYASVSSNGTTNCQNVGIPFTISPASASGAITVTASPNGDTAGSNGYFTTYPQNGSGTAYWCPPATSGMYTVTVNYAGDSTTSPASTSRANVYVAPGGPVITLGSWKMTNSSTCTVTATVEDGTPGTTAYLYTAGGTKAGSGMVSGGQATISFQCATGTTYNFVGVYQPQSQRFISPYRYSVKFTASGGVNVGSTAMERGSAPVLPMTAAENAAGTRAKPSGTRGTVDPAALVPQNIGVMSVRKRAKVTSTKRSISLQCPTGSYPLNGDAGSSGPDTDFGVAFSGRKATFTSGAANVGTTMSASLTCRTNGSAAQMIGSMGFGTRGGDTFSASQANATMFGGPGRDRISAVGNNSSAWGGFGADRITVAGRDSVGAGGPGNDRVIALGGARQLVWGGEGRDTLIGGPGPTLINARDGRGGDRITCNSTANRVMLDTGDITSGPCRVITTN